MSSGTRESFKGLGVVVGIRDGSGMPFAPICSRLLRRRRLNHATGSDVVAAPTLRGSGTSTVTRKMEDTRNSTGLLVRPKLWISA